LRGPLFFLYARKDSNPRPSEPESAGIFHNMLLYKGLEGYYKKRSRYVPGFLCLPWHYLSMWGGALCREQAEEWQTKKRYLDMELLGSQRREE